MYYDIRAYDKLYSDFKEMCRRACGENFNYFCIEMTKNIIEGKYHIFNESKITYTECICVSKAF